MKKNAKLKAAIVLAVMLALTVTAGWLGFCGMNLTADGMYKLLPWLPTTDADAWPESLPLGLDLRGGVYVEYSAAQAEDDALSFDELLDSTMEIIQARLTNEGYPECTTQKVGTDGIRVEIPDVDDPAAVLELIGEPAQLEFRTPDGTVFMTGKQVSAATAAYSETSAQAVVQLQFNKEGSKTFEDMTRTYLGRRLGIYLDGQVLLDATVNTVIAGGSCEITGVGTIEDAQIIASQIQSGALPLVLTQQKVDTVSATLGDDALTSSVKAAAIGIVLIMALLIFRYRLNGVIASWALVIYIILLFFAIAVIPGIQLTLPGIAGIVLGIGMAVDANVIIFERFNEEVRAGRSLKAAVRAGTKNASAAIIDANVTTIIAAFVLFLFGTGSIKGFGVTLALSVGVSVITAFLITRFLMRQVVNLRRWKPAVFTSGVKAEREGE